MQETTINLTQYSQGTIDRMEAFLEKHRDLSIDHKAIKAARAAIALAKLTVDLEGMSFFSLGKAVAQRTSALLNPPKEFGEMDKETKLPLPEKNDDPVYTEFVALCLEGLRDALKIKSTSGLAQKGVPNASRLQRNIEKILMMYPELRGEPDSVIELPDIKTVKAEPEEKKFTGSAEQKTKTPLPSTVPFDQKSIDFIGLHPQSQPTSENKLEDKTSVPSHSDDADQHELSTSERKDESLHLVVDSKEEKASLESLIRFQIKKQQFSDDLDAVNAKIASLEQEIILLKAEAHSLYQNINAQRWPYFNYKTQIELHKKKCQIIKNKLQDLNSQLNIRLFIEQQLEIVIEVARVKKENFDLWVETNDLAETIILKKRCLREKIAEEKHKREELEKQKLLEQKRSIKEEVKNNPAKEEKNTLVTGFEIFAYHDRIFKDAIAKVENWDELDPQSQVEVEKMIRSFLAKTIQHPIGNRDELVNIIAENIEKALYEKWLGGKGIYMATYGTGTARFFGFSGETLSEASLVKATNGKISAPKSGTLSLQMKAHSM